MGKGDGVGRAWVSLRGERKGVGGAGVRAQDYCYVVRERVMV